MALGARRAGVIWMVMREVCVLAVLGLAISIPLARGLSGLVQSFLFKMEANDPIAIATALAALLAAALVASYGPARRASRIEPTTALRQD
jgi:ABC-type antimicrobial peptide transport system permease subunit